MDPEKKKPSLKQDLSRLKRLARISVAVGTLLAIACHFLPTHYRAVCNAVATLCTGG